MDKDTNFECLNLVSIYLLLSIKIERLNENLPFEI